MSWLGHRTAVVPFSCRYTAYIDVAVIARWVHHGLPRRARWWMSSPSFEVDGYCSCDGCHGSDYNAPIRRFCSFQRCPTRATKLGRHGGDVDEDADEVISLDTSPAHTSPRHDLTEWCFIGGGIATTGSLGQLPRHSRACTTLRTPLTDTR